jgi:hypothetical protein
LGGFSSSTTEFCKHSQCIELGNIRQAQLFGTRDDKRDLTDETNQLYSTQIVGARLKLILMFK